MPINANTMVSQKIPGTPAYWLIIGPMIIPPIKDKPIVIPIMAIMRVRFSSRVKSAANAIVGPATAPIP